MRTFKIIALSVSGRGKKIFKAREIAREDELPAGAIDKLIAGKYIEEVKPEAPEVSDAAAKAKADEEARLKAEEDAEAEKAAAAEKAKLDEEEAAATAAAAANEKTDGLPEKNTGDGKSEKSTPAPSKNGKK